jgi:hypothetical protein
MIFSTSGASLGVVMDAEAEMFDVSDGFVEELGDVRVVEGLHSSDVSICTSGGPLAPPAAGRRPAA